jgi:hypothetical protein
VKTRDPFIRATTDSVVPLDVGKKAATLPIAWR